jgi:uncharacterized RDD family membrane protein YckC
MNDDAMPPLPDDAAPVGLLRRLAAIVYDALVIAGLVLFVLALVIIPLGMAVGQERWEQIQHAWWMRLGIQLLVLGVVVGFHVLFWWRGGQTVGMRAWRLQVRREDGAPLSARDALLRYGAAWLAAAPLGIGFLASLWDPHGRAWHDRWTATRLVKLARRRRTEPSA